MRDLNRRAAAILAILAGLALLFAVIPFHTRNLLVSALRAHIITLATVFSFTVVALSVVWYGGWALDSKILRVFNMGGVRRPWVDPLVWGVSQLGSAVAAFLVAALFLARGHRRDAIEITLGTLTLWLVVEAMKILTDRARPFLALEGVRVVGWREPGRSFPSGHTAQAMFMATVLAQILGLGAGEAVGLYGVAVVVGMTRMYVGVHFPRDVLGGAMLGVVWGVLMRIVESRWSGGG